MRAARAVASSTSAARPKPVTRHASSAAIKAPTRAAAAAATTPSRPAERENAGTPRQSKSSSSRASAPQFAYLLMAGLDAVGVNYISMDHLRKAKKNAVSTKEYLELWKLLHDLVLVVLADFSVDINEVRAVNAADSLEAALMDPDSQQIRVELVRYYLYNWGFVCSSFYDQSAVIIISSSSDSSQHAPASQDLLLAIAWLLAFSRFFERLQEPILEKCVGSAETLVLPPYPNDVVLSKTQLQQALNTVTATTSLYRGAPREPPAAQAFGSQVHQIHAAFGRLQSHTNELKAYLRYHERLLLRLERMQNKADDERDELIPAFVIQLLAKPKTALEFHLRLLAQRVKMVDDEKLFYKWINSLVATYPSTVSAVGAAQEDDGSSTSRLPPAAAANLLADKFPTLYDQVQRVQALFQVNVAAYQQLSKTFELEWRRWKQEKQRSRAQLQQMELKMERVSQDVRSQELFDPQKLFLHSARSWSKQSRKPQHVVVNGATSANPRASQQGLPSERELESLRSQLQRVLREISTEYCSAELR